MSKGFIYKYDRCVSCLACVTACWIENGNEVAWRTVITDNPDAWPGLPVHNLSIACNHCESPSCLDGCPTGAYNINISTGAVVLDRRRCMGCNYCYWNCPYDAPAYNPGTKEVEKCTFCMERLEIDLQPACTAACPTGALKFGDHRTTDEKSLLIETVLKPRISTKGPRNKYHITEVFPVESTDGYTADHLSAEEKVSAVGEWSLFIFTYLSSLLAGLTLDSWSDGVLPSKILVLILLTGIIILPFFHLGKPVRSVLSLKNIPRSPLSKEIGGLIIFVISIHLAFFINSVSFIGIAGLAGIIYTVLIDNVYIFSDRRLLTRIHPARTFLTALAIASFFSGAEMAFLFISLIKIGSTIWIRRLLRPADWKDLFGSVYVAVLVYLNISIIIGASNIIMILVLLLAELINRGLFYQDFSPPSNSNIFIKRNHLK
ncbi:MAG TPA: 4Fe-4S dicluster domain-containing protein [Bacteroidales bacterium]|nr:4Fe-4S dicluster domain-containing protein [Bacteroidales bacterium]